MVDLQTGGGAGTDDDVALGDDPPFDEDDDDDDDDVVVLSWWQHPVNVIAMLLALGLIGAMIGWLVADGRAGRGGGQADVGFLHDMRAHHEQAAQMGFMYLALPDTDPSLRTVARSIVYGQGIEVGRMIQLLRDMGAPEAAETEEAMAWKGMPTTVDAMPGLATEAELDELGASRGVTADERFVELMVEHHRGGIEMADFAETVADDNEVRAMAVAIADSQRDEIGELERLVD